jgi:hypothetical protein
LILLVVNGLPDRNRTWKKGILGARRGIGKRDDKKQFPFFPLLAPKKPHKKPHEYGTDRLMGVSKRDTPTNSTFNICI